MIYQTDGDHPVRAEVLKCFVERLIDKKIVATLNTRLHTVGNHVQNIYVNVECANREDTRVAEPIANRNTRRCR